MGKYLYDDEDKTGCFSGCLKNLLIFIIISILALLFFYLALPLLGVSILALDELNVL